MFAAFFAGVLAAPQTVSVYQAPAGKEFAKVVPGGVTILPNGRLLTPTGQRLYTGEDLWNVLLSPDGAAVIGQHDTGLTVYRGLQDGKPDRTFLARPKTAPTGCFLPKSGLILVSLGDEGAVELIDTKTLESKGKISVNAGRFVDSYVNDLKATKDEAFAYGVDVAHQRVVVIDLKEKRFVESIPAGRQPYAIALSEDEKRLFVANIGIFNYSLIPPSRSNPTGPRSLTKPPFGFPSRESEQGVEQDDRQVPGLGSPYVPDAQSIYQYDLTNRAEPKLARRQKAGILIHAPADGGKSVGGSSPNALLARGSSVWVSNANNDTVQELDAATLAPRRTIKLTPAPGLRRLRGVIPSGMAMSKDGRRLFVCESGLNSVAVIDTKTSDVLGRIPTGWFPVQAALSPDEKTIYVATQKGIGRGPRGAKNVRPNTDERFGLPDMPGMIHAAPVPDSAGLRRGSEAVSKNNGLVPVRVQAGPASFSRTAGKPSPVIKHVVFITKENHTYDGILGGLAGGKGEPDYAEFGIKGWIREKGRDERLPIMPNHVRLAEQFACSDNFYMEPQASGDGHRWLVGVYPSLWTTRVFYSGWEFRPKPGAEGRFVSFGSYGSQFPEDFLENGSMWEHLDRNRISFRNYGEGYEMPRGFQGDMTGMAMGKAGVFPIMNHPMPLALYRNTCFDFPAYNTHIPDIARADWFKEDLVKTYFSKGKGLPGFLNIAICNDHGDSARPDKGYPYVCSYMADNDLALGRIVEHLSRRPEWKNMVIFVTQDDPGGDSDHIDRHRSICLAISPWVKRGHISRDHTSIMSIIKSIYLLLGLGPNNMFDAVATDLSDMFTDTPDFTPYTHVPVDARVFKPEDTFDPSDPKFERRRREAGAGVKMDDPKFIDWLRRGGSGAYRKDQDGDGR